MADLILTTVMILFIGVSSLATIGNVGKPRKPVTNAGAVAVTLINTALIAAVCWGYVHTHG